MNEKYPHSGQGSPAAVPAESSGAKSGGATAQLPSDRSLLLHACCGPCSLEPVRALREEGLEPVIYYANSNIHPADEYRRRLDTLRRWADGEKLAVVEGAYDPGAWEATAGTVGDAARAAFGVITHEAQPAGCPAGPEAAPEESKTLREAAGAAYERTPCAASPASAVPSREDGGADAAGSDGPERARQARCRACYRMRFEEAARWAADNGFKALGTTLSVSPYQYTAIIGEELKRACAREGITARFDDWRPYYDEATRRSREEGMYRQNYCGCRFSDEEAAMEREQRKAARKARREAEKTACRDQREAEKRERDAKRAEKQAYAEKQRRKKEVLKALRAEGKAPKPSG